MPRFSDPAPSPGTDYKDSKTGLVVFGILTILIGGLCALFVPLMFFGQAMAEKSGTPSSTQMMLPGILIYGVLAVVLVWLGIGSIMARRWARALLLILSWTWLTVGVFSLCMMPFILPRLIPVATGQASPPPAVPDSVMVLIPMIVIGVIFVMLPGAWIFFYQSRHVKATCEARDPIVRWTDRCPLPVLAVCIWLAFTVPVVLLIPLFSRCVLAFFGMILVGPAAYALYVVFAVLWAYLAWAFYHLDRRGWWAALATMCLFTLSSFVTFSRHDFNELYRLMGYPEQQIAQIQKFSLFTGQGAAWTSLLAAVPTIAYLLFLRRYFGRPNPSEA